MNARSPIRNAFFIGITLVAQIMVGQAPSVAPAKAATPPSSMGAYEWLYRAGLTCGTGASNSLLATKPTVQCGGSFSFFLPFLDLEVGVMGPQANQSAVSGYLRANSFFPLIPSKHLGNKYGVPLVVGGYTRMFETGHALDYGLAFAHPIDEYHSVQFEVRDYWGSRIPINTTLCFALSGSQASRTNPSKPHPLRKDPL
jgi:hypothetical protein